MTNGRNYRGNVAKRRIEHINCSLSHAIPTTATDLTLHSCEDSKTLVRMIITGQVSPYGTIAAASEIFDILVAVQPAGQNVKNPILAEDLDREASKLELFRFKGMVSVNANDDMIRIEFDSKGMRKLEPGDQIVWTDIGTTANKMKVNAWVQLYFKE